MRLIILFLLVLSTHMAFGQVEEYKHWCRLNCDPSRHTENVELVYKFIQLDSVKNELKTFQNRKFPIRFVYVNSSHINVPEQLTNDVGEVITQLNHAFENVNFTFYLEKIEKLDSDLKLEDLSGNRNNIYDVFSNKYDKEDIITIYIMDYKSEFCEITTTSISCSKIGGFSYILSNRTNNIVLSHFDLREPKTVAHELGHFFGLYHTFEEQLFSKDVFNEDNCYVVGDRLCDTPPDPGVVFEVYVNYSRCEMINFKNAKGQTYDPHIENYMSYYKPCYLQPYSFTQEQVMIMQLASQLSMRNKFSRK